MHRLFIAIDFIAGSTFLKYYQKTASVFTKLDKYNLVKPELMHITLKFLGETETEKIHSVVRGMQQAVKNIPVLDLKTGKTGIFGSRYQPRVLWIEIEKTAMLEQLHQQLQKEMRKTGFKSDFGNFVPHLTLARINKIDDKRYFWKKMESIPQDFVQHIHADKIILYESILTGYVPVYRKLEEIFLSNA